MAFKLETPEGKKEFAKQKEAAENRGFSGNQKSLIFKSRGIAI